MKGHRIWSLELLAYTVQTRRSVIVPMWAGFKKPRPAAFVFNMAASVVFRMFKSGMYIYEKEK